MFQSITLNRASFISDVTLEFNHHRKSERKAGNSKHSISLYKVMQRRKSVPILFIVVRTALFLENCRVRKN